MIKLMKYQVIYYKKKKDKYAKQVAGDFLSIEDAFWYENQIKLNGHNGKIEIVPVL